MESVDSEFLNLFIENMSKKIEELSRKEIFNLTQITMLERKVQELHSELVNLRKEFEKNNYKIEKQLKKTKEKEVNTSTETGPIF